jgi:hypothetical protein
MDNGCEVFAKLPNPNAGAARFTIASEIATRKLVRLPTHICYVQFRNRIYSFPAG